MKRALISVFDKTNIDKLAKFLVDKGIEILSTGGTATYLQNKGIPITTIKEFTGYPEILDGRVKTLHHKIYGGLLNIRNNENHQKEMILHNIKNIDLVVVNLYPFLDKPSIENIDIGGVSLIRAAAKNYHDVTVLTDPNDYKIFMNNFDNHNLNYREELAVKGFNLTSIYDRHISNWLQFKDLLR